MTLIWNNLARIKSAKNQLEYNPVRILFLDIVKFIVNTHLKPNSFKFALCYTFYVFNLNKILDLIYMLYMQIMMIVVYTNTFRR